eukprot:CAMPEP_0116854400 /NCGR_PEP_ID=MMETSP0418-20121206/18574_1 /TAXON_ID=1158023 /ORGANISM="Astrosyne radiata, Strain 13vi08-1A" /LENGTH=300 /DNA_ID=CAMNT_0004487163 /DNA_START=1 /DNA_END=903 /DNA_ORIENTATION=+
MSSQDLPRTFNSAATSASNSSGSSSNEDWLSPTEFNNNKARRRKVKPYHLLLSKMPSLPTLFAAPNKKLSSSPPKSMQNQKFVFQDEEKKRMAARRFMQNEDFRIEEDDETWASSRRSSNATSASPRNSKSECSDIWDEELIVDEESPIEEDLGESSASLTEEFLEKSRQHHYQRKVGLHALNQRKGKKDLYESLDDSFHDYRTKPSMVKSGSRRVLRQSGGSQIRFDIFELQPNLSAASPAQKTATTSVLLGKESTLLKTARLLEKCDEEGTPCCLQLTMSGEAVICSINCNSNEGNSQ